MESALDALVVVAQKAFSFFDKVDIVISYAGATLWPLLREKNCAPLSICSRQEVSGECQSCLGYLSENFELHRLHYVHCMLRLRLNGIANSVSVRIGTGF